MDKLTKQKITAGDKQAFQNLYEKHIDSALRTAMAITRNENIAKDAVQETFIRVYKNLDSFDTDKKFTPWFFKILTNECNRLLKKESKILKLNTPLDGKEFKTASAAEEDYDELYEAIQSLKDSCRLPIILKYLQGFSEKEIAQILSLNQNTVKSRLLKGRQVLKEKLNENELEGGPQYGC
ncbi:RNA polymerase sigma factor [Natranaerofaba carboxydovora]|uniref:RNA polymerase sigma factor n=1 Tax=Natranaerofaba carboxydovora TaxID=2742683 RepID=UPI001F135F8E|nr:RNA polymerase sigma factor [Natranaerofaba carboxydovora]UMZ73044.1 ECF RNA polymerase sigma factor SigW [Natranaerofaba carboxydovora]